MAIARALAAALCLATPFAAATPAASAAWSSSGVDVADFFSSGRGIRSVNVDAVRSAAENHKDAPFCMVVLPQDVDALAHLGSFATDGAAPTPLHRALREATSQTVALGASATEAEVSALEQALAAAGRSPQRLVVAADGEEQDVAGGVPLSQAADAASALVDAAPTGAVVVELRSGQDAATAARFVADAVQACSTAARSGVAVLLSRRQEGTAPAGGRRLLASEAVGADPAAKAEVHMSPAIMAGLLASLMLISFVTVGVCALSSIKTPRLLPTQPPVVGREY